MKLLTVLLAVADPLIIAFTCSVIIGITCKYVAAIIFIKRVVSSVAFMLYFLLYYAAVNFFIPFWKYTVMFAPFAIIILALIISLIAAPKGSVKKNIDKEYKMTGWDTMFPNDIDNK